MPLWIKHIIEGQDKARFDRAHLLKFGDSSLDFEVVFFVLDADYNVYMDVQQAINLEIMQRFEIEEINFAYPSRTLFFENAGQLSPPGTLKPALHH
ncbi:hypothetical protein ACQ86N_30270 [Puia sp. P3]|uniref:hypothetical protein n=1 Tax=Puia sp. P3 TaxID=3423952 RepID=UPI003D66B07B